MLSLSEGDPQLRHLNHAWASTVQAFQGRTVANVIAAMEANHPHLTTQKSFYVEISRARNRAELLTDDAARLHEQLKAVTGERILVAGGDWRGGTGRARQGCGSRGPERRGVGARQRGGSWRHRPIAESVDRDAQAAKDREPSGPVHGQRVERDLGQ